MLPGLWLHGGERQTAFAAVPAQQVHRFLDRDGVDVREQGVDQRQQLQLELAALRDLAVKEKLADLEREFPNHMPGNPCSREPNAEVSIWPCLADAWLRTQWSL